MTSHRRLVDSVIEQAEMLQQSGDPSELQQFVKATTDKYQSLTSAAKVRHSLDTEVARQFLLDQDWE